jgi:hypothetical protein
MLIRKASHFQISAENLQLIYEILQNPLLTAPVRTSSFLINHYYLMIKAILHFLLNDAACYDYALQNITAWHEKSFFIDHYPEYYIEVLYTFYYAAIMANDHSKIEHFMKMPADSKMLLPSDVSYIQTIQHLALNRYYNRTGQYDQVALIIASIKKQFPTWANHINTELKRTLLGATGISYFVLQNYEDAFHFTKNALLLFNDEARIEQISFLHLFIVIICCEWNNQRLFDIQYKSSYTYFSKNRTKDDFERKLLVYFSKLFYANSSANKKKTLEQTQLFIKKHEQEHRIHMIFNYFNIPGWIASKIQNKDYKEWVQLQHKT